MAQAILIPVLAAVATTAVTVGATALLAPKPPAPTKQPMALPVPTRTAALSQALNQDDAFRRRQGAASTMVTGASGAEAPSPGAKALLGQ
jgi:hypothetical protein